MLRALPALMLAATTLLLAACSTKEGNGSLSIDMNSQADAGNVSVSIPGFDTKLQVPTGLMRHGNFDIDGVKLYPRSTVTAFNINVDRKTTSGDARGPLVRMAFVTPADVATVTNWYKGQFAAKSVMATQTATGFSGKTSKGDTFTLALNPGKAGQTDGTIALVDAGK